MRPIVGESYNHHHQQDRSQRNLFHLLPQCQFLWIGTDCLEFYRFIGQGISDSWAIGSKSAQGVGGGEGIFITGP
jgi:hypothetical protein